MRERVRVRLEAADDRRGAPAIYLRGVLPTLDLPTFRMQKMYGFWGKSSHILRVRRLTNIGWGKRGRQTARLSPRRRWLPGDCYRGAAGSKSTILPIFAHDYW